MAEWPIQGINIQASDALIAALVAHWAGLIDIADNGGFDGDLVINIVSFKEAISEAIAGTWLSNVVYDLVVRDDHGSDTARMLEMRIRSIERGRLRL